MAYQAIHYAAVHRAPDRDLRAKSKAPPAEQTRSKQQHGQQQIGHLFSWTWTLKVAAQGRSLVSKESSITPVATALDAVQTDSEQIAHGPGADRTSLDQRAKSATQGPDGQHW